VPPDVLCYLAHCFQNLNRILPPSLQNLPDQPPYQFITVHTARNVHAGENIRLQNAGHKQTASYLSLKVSLKNHRLHEKKKAVSDVCRMKQCTRAVHKEVELFLKLIALLTT